MNNLVVIEPQIDTDGISELIEVPIPQTPLIEVISCDAAPETDPVWMYEKQFYYTKEEVNNQIGVVYARFGIEDDTALTNRNVNMQFYHFNVIRSGGVNMRAEDPQSPDYSGLIMNKDYSDMIRSGSASNVVSRMRVTDTSSYLSYTEGETYGNFVTADNASVSFKQIRIQGSDITTRIVSVPFGSQDSVMPLSVNGIFPDSRGNIFIEAGGGGGGSTPPAVFGDDYFTL
jgi:hypothetical protein